jgi:hypothetical protein
VSVDDVKQPVKAVTEAKTMKVKSLTAVPFVGRRV